MALTDEEAYAYAEHLLEESGDQFEYLTIFEAAEEYFGEGTELSDEDGRRVDKIIADAVISISLPGDPRPSSREQVFRIVGPNGYLVPRTFQSKLKRLYPNAGDARRALQWAPPGSRVQASDTEWVDL